MISIKGCSDDSDSPCKCCNKPFIYAFVQPAADRYRYAVVHDKFLSSYFGDPAYIYQMGAVAEHKIPVAFQLPRQFPDSGVHKKAAVYAFQDAVMSCGFGMDDMACICRPILLPFFGIFCEGVFGGRLIARYCNRIHRWLISRILDMGLSGNIF